MAKVVSLLKDLSAKLAEEGKREAAEYDKYACFLKAQSSEKQHAIERSDANRHHLGAQIEHIGAAKAEMESQLQKLDQKASDLETQAAGVARELDLHHEKYLDNAKELDEAIDSCSAALKAIKDAKSQMRGAKVDLMQVTDSLKRLTRKLPLLMDGTGALTLLSKLKAAPKYEFQSNEIMATLQQLSASFASMKKSLDLDDHKATAMFESSRLGLLSSKKFAEKERVEVESLVEAKLEELQTAKVQDTQEEADGIADKAFLKDLEGEGAEKASLFDQRSQARAAELTTLAKAITTLQDGAAPNYAAIAGVVGLQMGAVASVGTTPTGVSPATFVQLHSVQDETEHSREALQHVQSLLSEAAERIDSSALSNIALRLKNPSSCRMVCPKEKPCYKYCPNKFENVRSLIKDLLGKLQDDMTDEMKQKTMCDKAMHRSITERDSASDKTEVAAGHLDVLESDRDMFEEDTKVASRQLAEFQRALLEANMLHEEDAKTKKDAIDMYEDGARAVEFALTTLTDFYSTAFVQVRSHTMQDSEAESATSLTQAPEVFDSEYHGARAEAKGITGILEVVLADFRRSKRDTEADLQAATADLSRFTIETNKEIKLRTTRMEKNSIALQEIKNFMVNEEEEVRDNKKFHENAVSTLEVWKADCVQGDSAATWEDRKEKRDSEIEALKQAHGLLEEWQ